MQHEVGGRAGLYEVEFAGLSGICLLRLMSDFDETDVFWESWTWTAEKGKKKKNSKKDKKCLKRKNNMTMETDENIQKKKKKKKFKDALEGKKEKKKGKKKNRMALELDDSLILTQSSSAQTKPAVKPQTLNPHGIDTLTDCKKKSRRKKKVAFDLSPGITSVKRRKCVSSSQQSPKKSILSENEAVRDGESCSQVTVTGYSHGQTHANESQSTVEDINSQDLFITQKTFRTSPPEPSSAEASDKALTTSPQGFTPRDKLYTSMALTKQHLEGPYKCPQDSHFHQHHRKTNKDMQKPKTLQVLLTEEEEEERLSKAHQDLKKRKWLKANITEEKIVSRPAHTTPSVLNACSLDVAKSKKHSRTSSQHSSSCLCREPSVPPPMSMGSTSTQTENFFTTELSSYLNFYQNVRVSVHLEDLQPLDLSLPQRARKDLGMCLSVKTLSLPGAIKGGNHKEPNLHPSCSSDMNDAAVKEEPSGHHLWSVSTQGKRETTQSPQSEPEPKSADTTTSSEDEPPCRSGKLDLTQVRAVQMRLNESFFFKTKGEGQSPRPESPLMKLVQGREVKNRKGH